MILCGLIILKLKFFQNKISKIYLNKNKYERKQHQKIYATNKDTAVKVCKKYNVSEQNLQAKPDFKLAFK